MARRSDSRPTVEIPRRDDDHPAWMQVGIIAAVCFVVGVAWPKLTQTRLAPRPPTVNAQAKAEDPKPAAEPPTAPKASVSAPSEAAAIPAGKPAKSPALEVRTVVVDAANVRAEPKSKTVTGKLVRGAKVQVLAREGAWVRVRYGKEPGQEGWIFGRSIGK